MRQHLVSGRAHDFPRPGSAEDRTLSPREDQVFALTAAGQSAKEIAHALGVTEGAVAQVSNRLRRKLGVHSATQLALLWHGCDLAAARAFAQELGRRA